MTLDVGLIFDHMARNVRFIMNFAVILAKLAFAVTIPEFWAATQVLRMAFFRLVVPRHE